MLCRVVVCRVSCVKMARGDLVTGISKVDLTPPSGSFPHGELKMRGITSDSVLSVSMPYFSRICSM